MLLFHCYIARCSRFEAMRQVISRSDIFATGEPGDESLTESSKRVRGERLPAQCPSTPCQNGPLNVRDRPLAAYTARMAHTASIVLLASDALHLAAQDVLARAFSHARAGLQRTRAHS
jgi:hypothetical protein